MDERNELFLYTPDRLVLALRDAPDLTAAGDTTIGGERHTLVRATVRGGLPLTVAFHAGTGLPAMLRFRQGHPNDFGLVPFGRMDVVAWYSGWRTFGDISIPTQWDIERAGAPYKRMTVLAANFDPTFAPDSFVVSDELRQAFLDTRAPMHDRPIDSVTVALPGLLRIHAFGFPAGAIHTGNEWVLLEAGHAPLNLDRTLDELGGHDVQTISSAVVVAARNGNGGVARLVERGVPVYTSVAEEPFIDVMLKGYGVEKRGITVVREGMTIANGTLRLEPIALPDYPGSLMIYAPELEWLYLPDAATALDVRIGRARAAELGWTVSVVGTARGVDVPL